MRDLLRSAPDAHSPLSGHDLVALKVSKVVFQGGWYQPMHVDNHTTFNWDCGNCCGYRPEEGCAGAAAHVVNTMPETVEMIYSDIGDGVWHGGALSSCAPQSSPCRKAYELYLGPGNNRPSWDPVVVAIAVRGPRNFFGHLTDRGWRNVVDYQGANHWAPTQRNDTLQSQFALNGPYPWEQNRWLASLELDRLLCREPANGNATL